MFKNCVATVRSWSIGDRRYQTGVWEREEGNGRKREEHMARKTVCGLAFDVNRLCSGLLYPESQTMSPVLSQFYTTPVSSHSRLIVVFALFCHFTFNAVSTMAQPAAEPSDDHSQKIRMALIESCLLYTSPSPRDRG